MSRLDDILEILARYRPDYGVCRIAELGEGTDHRAYEINGELVLRFSTDPDPAGRAALTRRQGSLLTKVATLSPLPTPVPDLVLPAEGCLAYRRLPGEPLSGLPVAERRRLGLAATRTLGAFLTAVHGLPMHLIADLVAARGGAVLLGGRR